MFNATRIGQSEQEHNEAKGAFGFPEGASEMPNEP
jgi:hypothetical protein